MCTVTRVLHARTSRQLRPNASSGASKVIRLRSLFINWWRSFCCRFFRLMTISVWLSPASTLMNARWSRNLATPRDSLDQAPCYSDPFIPFTSSSADVLVDSPVCTFISPLCLRRSLGQFLVTIHKICKNCLWSGSLMLNIILSAIIRLFCLYPAA